ncbi:MAG: hypothetical protein ILN61_04025 [Lachnospiraceae bacterium]|nr:hypothetical protein [Lachnospiraceae bacterium]
MITRELRKQLGLPLTKELVYYPPRYEDKTHSPIAVDDVKVVREFPSYYTLEITLKDCTKKIVHSKYFASMQSPHFLDDMKKDAEAVNAETWFDW